MRLINEIDNKISMVELHFTGIPLFTKLHHEKGGVSNIVQIFVEDRINYVS